MYFFVLPIILPLMLDQFQLSFTGVGGLLTAFLLVVALCSVVVGRLSDRISPPLIIGIGFLLASGSLLAAGMIQRPAFLVLLLLLSALGVSTYHPAIYNLLNNATDRKKGITFGLFELWGSAAILLLFLVAGFVLKRISWKIFLAISSIPGFFFGVMFLMFRHKLRIKSPPPAGVEPPQRKTKGELGLFVLVCISSMLIFMSFTVIMNLVPTYLVHGFNLSTSQASYATAFLFAGGMAGAPLAGHQLDRRDPLRIYLIPSIAIIPLIVLFSFRFPIWMYPLLLVLIGVCSGVFMPSRNMVFAHFGRRMGSGQIFGIVMGVGITTQSLSPLLFGLIADRSTLLLAMGLSALPAVFGTAAGLVLLILSRTRTYYSESAP
jgi:FSR family fosmidomycin resistance protein-like MFS transporter